MRRQTSGTERDPNARGDQRVGPDHHVNEQAQVLATWGERVRAWGDNKVRLLRSIYFFFFRRFSINFCVPAADDTQGHEHARAHP